MMHMPVKCHKSYKGFDNEYGCYMNTNYTWCKSGCKLVWGQSLGFNSELIEFALRFTPRFIYHKPHIYIDDMLR